jgi:hypothetical protein
MAMVEARRLVLATLLTLCCLAASASERMNVEQLEDRVASAQKLPDREAAERLIDVELTERLTRARFERLKAVLPGDRSKEALLAVADSSAFLDLPAADRLVTAPPATSDQGRIVSRAADFVVATVSRMPDFIASRTILRFQDHRVTETGNGSSVVTDAPMHFKDRKTDVVTFRNGREVTDIPGDKGVSSVTSSTGLVNWGIFGPLLGVVMTDVMRGKIGWGHWEQGATGPLAVFRYVVPRDRSNYTVRYCCFRSDDGEMREFEAVPAYHGEMAIDPATGAIYRLVVKTDLQPLAGEEGESLPMDRVDTLVEYGPVEIGGKTCICPVESTTVSRAEAIVFHGYTFYVNRKGKPDSSGTRQKHIETASQPEITAINDVVFGDYHQFRGEMHILPADHVDVNVPSPGPNRKTPPS